MRFDLESHTDATALIDAGGVAHSYGELAASARALSDVLKSRSVVLCLTRNAIGAVIGYLACINSRAVPILVDCQASRPALLNMVATYLPRYIWTPEELAGAFTGYDAGYRVYGYCLLERVAPEKLRLHDDLGLLLTTSGSTGSPKLVRISYRNLSANTRSIVEYLGLTAGERTITTLPFNYAFGLSILNTFLYVGASIVLTESSLFQREFWDAMRQHRVSSLSGVPYTFEMLKRLRFFGMELPDLRTLTQAGGKLAENLCREFAEAAYARGIRFLVMYGATEATARMSYLPAEQALAKAGSIGVAIPGGAFELIGGSGAAAHAPIGEELVYRGPNVAMGYAENLDDLAKGDEFGGVLKTGDLARRDEDGYFFVVGRIKRFVKLYGVRTNLDDVERLVLEAFPGIDVACTGEDNHLLVYVQDQSACRRVHDYLSKTMQVSPSAITTRYVESIPRSASGKIRYADL